jgi:CubicO group peptidase (beta-lactamase class C family)
MANARNIMRKLTILFLIFVSPLFVYSQSLDEKLKEIDAYANTVIATHKGPGMAIAIVKDDKVVLSKGYGTRELGKNEPVDENTVFAIASNSKAFTTASLAILVDEKKLSWDDKVSKYLPDFQMYDPWVTSELMVRDLVTHRVGLDTFSGDLLWYETTYSPDEVLRRVHHLKPVSSFRTRFGYQNLMFIAAGKVIEKVSGKPWCDFVTERILAPLGMSRTTCSVKNLPDNAAWPHNESGGKLRVLHRGNVDGAYSAAALNSSVSDLSKWVRTQLAKGKFEGKQIFSEQQAWQMYQQYLAQQISEPAFKNNPTRHFSGVAMGWFVYDYHGRKIINHSGGLDGMLSYTVLIPEENVGFVVLTNSESPAFGVMMNKIRDVFVNAPKRDWNAESVEQAKRSKDAADQERQKVDAARVKDTRPSLALANYAGTYSDNLYGDITVSEKNGKLVMRFGPSPNFVADLEHWHYDTFEIRWRPSVAYNFPRGFVTFTIDKDGKTDEIKIDQPNNDFWFYELTPRRVK